MTVYILCCDSQPDVKCRVTVARRLDQALEGIQFV